MFWRCLQQGVVSPSGMHRSISHLSCSIRVSFRHQLVQPRLPPSILVHRLHSPSTQKENIYTLPNLLTVSRLCMCPIIYTSITALNYPTALIYLSIASVTDILDGFIARRYNMGTMLGSVLDPFADKMLMTTLVLGLTSANLLSMPMALLILGRDMGLILGTAYYRYKSLAPPKTVTRYFDLSLPSAQVNTLLQLSLMWATLGAPVFGYMDATWLLWLNYSVAATTIGSGAHYLLFKENVKVLGKDWRSSSK